MSLAVAGCAAGARGGGAGGGAPAEARAASGRYDLGLGGFIRAQFRGELGRVRSLGSGPLGLGGASVPCPGRPVAPPTLAGARTRPRLRRRWHCQRLGQALALAAEQALQCQWHGGRPPVALAPTGRDTATSMWRRRTEVGNSFNLFKLL
jgi:hypothetical protein